MKHHLPLLSLPLLFLLAACGGDTTSDDGAEAAGADAGPHPLESRYLAEAPEDAVEVNELRSLEDGAEVVVRGDVGEYEPVEGRAVLQLVDHSLSSCDELPGDSCATPWDFCCIDDDTLRLGSALVEFRDDGELVAASLGGFHGLDHLSDVVVTGTLRLDDAGNAQIEADGLHVE